MKKEDLKKMTGGWFIGNFEPTLNKTNDVEVAVKRYKAGVHDPEHFHKVATEYTVIIEGEVVMGGKTYGKDDIIVISPGEATDFRTITDTVTVVVKLPGASNDKYLTER